MVTPWRESDGIRALDRWAIAAFSCGAVALILIVGVAIWGAMHDMQDLRGAYIQAETYRLRTHMTRVTSVINNQLAEDGDLKKVRDSVWLREFWAGVLAHDKRRLYGAVVDNQGRIVAHSNPAVEGKLLAAPLDRRKILEAGDDISQIADANLTGGREAFDIEAPIIAHGQRVATYHAGSDYNWLKGELLAKSRRAAYRWAGLLCIIAVVVAGAGVSLYGVAKRVTLFQQSLRMAHVRRLAELGQLMNVIAHEIRNPLNTMRLNLHVLDHQQRSTGGSVATLDGPEDGLTVIEATNREIERIESLIKVLVGYARPEPACLEGVDAIAELRETVGLLQPALDRARVQLVTRLTEGPIWLRIDRNRLRQILINLINNAKEAAGENGCVEVTTRLRGQKLDIGVIDSGPGLSGEHGRRIFEPFYTTKDQAIGLGLSLAKRFVEESGGEIHCRNNPDRGACFSVELPVDLLPKRQFTAANAAALSNAGNA